MWAISVLAEVLLFAFARKVLKRVSPVHLLLAGGLAAIVRWVSMSFDPPLAALVGLQVLHAFTFGATHLGAMHFIADAVPAAGGRHGPSAACVICGRGGDGVRGLCVRGTL